MTYSYLKVLLLNSYVDFTGTHAFKAEHESKVLSFWLPVLSYFPKNAGHILRVRWTPPGPLGLSMFRGVRYTSSWWRMRGLAWEVHADQPHPWEHANCWINMLASFITQPLALGFLRGRSNSLPNNDTCHCPCDCCPEELNPAKEQSHPLRAISRVDFYTYLDASIIL